eukprot:scaffold22575_cov141-Cylindrotheca_fusiformis.AAC.39
MSYSYKKVVFDELVTVRLIPSRTQSTTEELANIAFSPVDLRNIRKRERRLSEQLSLNGRLPTSGDNDSTGLYSFDAKSQRRKRISDGITTVLMEQEFQWNCEGMVNHDCIAEAYALTVHESRLLARHRGLETAMQVENSSNHDGSWTVQPDSKKVRLPNDNLLRWIAEITDYALVPMCQGPQTPTGINTLFSQKLKVIPIDDSVQGWWVE